MNAGHPVTWREWAAQQWACVARPGQQGLGTGQSGLFLPLPRAQHPPEGGDAAHLTGPYVGEQPERVLGWRPAGWHSARVHVLPSLLPRMGGANGFHLDRHTAGECGNTASKGRPVTDPKVTGQRHRQELTDSYLAKSKT